MRTHPFSFFLARSKCIWFWRTLAAEAPEVSLQIALSKNNFFVPSLRVQISFLSRFPLDVRGNNEAGQKRGRTLGGRADDDCENWWTDEIQMWRRQLEISLLFIWGNKTFLSSTRKQTNQPPLTVNFEECDNQCLALWLHWSKMLVLPFLYLLFAILFFPAGKLKNERPASSMAVETQPLFLLQPPRTNTTLYLFLSRLENHWEFLPSLTWKNELTGKK